MSLKPFFAVVEAKKQHSRKRIFAKYTEGRNAEQMVDFLKNEYGRTGKGFEINGNPVSVLFDEHGMSVGYGTQAKETPLVTMSWEEVENHIRSMIENGTYMSASEAFFVDTQERNRVANQIFSSFGMAWMRHRKNLD